MRGLSYLVAAGLLAAAGPGCTARPAEVPAVVPEPPPEAAAPAAPGGEAPLRSTDELIRVVGGTQLCGGHVSGARRADGRPGSHVTWSALASEEPRRLLVARLARELGAEPEEDDPGCATWRFPEDRPVTVLEVCDAGRGDRPWSRCDPPPPGTATVALVHSMTR
jgi:hypothetical protein